jgi:DNA-binding NarL/FixJ family response regulator
LLSLESDIEVIGEANSAATGLDIAGRLQPDVVVTDLALPERNGIQIISELRKNSPNIKVLVLTVHNSEEYIKAALNAGAHGYVLKDSSRVDLVGAIRAVAMGQRYLCGPVSAKIVNGYLGNADAKPVMSLQHLTDREREVLTLIALGKSNKRIAIQLGLSVKTIEKHRSNFMRKLELHNTAGVTMFAICNGLVAAEQVGVHADTEAAL